MVSNVRYNRKWQTNDSAVRLKKLILVTDKERQMSTFVLESQSHDFPLESWSRFNWIISQKSKGTFVIRKVDQ